MTSSRRAGVRLGVQIGLLIVALLVAVGGLALVLFERSEHADAEGTLRETARQLSPTESLPGFWVVLRKDDGTITTSQDLPQGMPVQPDFDRVVADGRARQREVDAGDLDLFVRTQARSDGVVQVAMDRTAAEESSGRLVTALLIAGLAGIALAAGLAALLARRATAPLEDALALQRRFVADASHELRTPLTLLSTRVQLVARRVRRTTGPLDAHLLEGDLDGVLADTRALSDILDDLLLAADGGAGDGHTVLDLAGVVGGAVASAQAHASERGVALDVHVPGSQVMVRGSEAALRRAITSLVDNALDHARSTVDVSLRSADRSVEMEVADDGAGVPPEQAEHVFERFTSSRSEDSPSGGRRHYGLGLALVADVADAHGGSVALASRETGTAFVLTLPRA